MAIDWEAYKAKKSGVASRNNIDWDSYAKKKGLVLKKEDPDAFETEIAKEVRKQKAPSMFTLPTVTEEGFTPLKLDMPEPANQLDWLGSALEKIVNVPSEAITGAINAISDLTTSGKKGAAKVGEAVSAVAKTAGAALSPISAGFSAAEEVPLLGYGAKAVNWGFGKVGEAGGALTKAAVNAMPFVSDEAKKELEKPFEELGALVSQIAVGGALTKGKTGYKAIEGKLDSIIAEKTAYVQSQGVQMTPAIAKKLAESAIRDIKNEIRLAEEVAKPKVEPQKVVSKKTPFAKETAGKLITELETVPETAGRGFFTTRLKESPDSVKNQFKGVVEEIGERALPKQEVIDIVRREFGLEKPVEAPTVVPIETKVSEPISGTKAPVEAIPEAMGAKPVEAVEPFKSEERPVPAEGVETKPSKPSFELMEQAIEKAVIKEKLELPETETLKMDVAREATRKLIKENPSRAFEVAMGRADAPVETRASMIWKAMSEYAMLIRDSKMVEELATKSTVPTFGVEAGRFGKAFDFSDTATSAVETIIKVQKTREAVAKKKYGEKPAEKAKAIERKAMDKELSKAKMKPKDWNSFIDEITCK
ncbi:MAG: hypothetical protein M0R06_06285 [Sphaerochaeta sp.]|jgi:hypothetical protein|nr:hypothetical protein [Sphaerochaeta sp.]